jgi:hypothetical protein
MSAIELNCKKRGEESNKMPDNPDKACSAVYVSMKEQPHYRVARNLEL